MILKKLLLLFIITFSIFGCVTEDDNEDDKIETFTLMADNEYDVYNIYWKFKKSVSLMNGETIEAPYYDEEFSSRVYVYILSSSPAYTRTCYIKEENMSEVYYRDDWTNAQNAYDWDLGCLYNYRRAFKGSKGTYKIEYYSHDTDELLSQSFFTEVTDSSKIDFLNNATLLPEEGPTSIGEN